MTEQYTLETPPQQPVQPPPQSETPKSSFQKNKIIIFAGLGIVALLLVFLSGFFLRGLTGNQTPTPSQTKTTPTPTLPAQIATPTLSPFSEIPASSIKFLPGKQYFEDVYAVVSKKEPYVTLILSVARIEQERNYVQHTSVNFYDGTEWKRKALTNTITNSNVATSTLLRNWSTNENSNSTKEVPLAEIMLEDSEVSIASKDLQTEISVQSLPGSTKFLYQGTGKITHNGETKDAHVLYTRVYSFNALDLEFFNSPENLNSNFISFWDEEGNFYYVDTHTTPNPTTAIQKRTVGIREDAKGSVSKTESISTDFRLQQGINEFIVRFSTPIDEQLRLTFVTTLNKAEKQNYTWILTNTSGNVVKKEGRTVKGAGIVEYIRPAQE